MLVNDGNISMSMMNEPEQVSEDDKKFLYARAVHSNHSIQYHIQQIIERQKVVDEYRSMMMEGKGLTPLESNLHKYDLVIISQIMQMIEADNLWHLKNFEAVLTDLGRRWDEQIHKQKDVSTHCMENSEINDEMDGIEVIDLCSESQTKNSELHEAKESTKQESQDKMKTNTIPRKERKNRPGKGKPMAESEENETAMMCWEDLKDSPGKEPHTESENEGEKPVKKMQTPKDEETCQAYSKYRQPTKNLDQRI